MKVIAVIPCWNEEKTIANIVSRTLRFVDACIVIDDGSSDNTAKVAETAGASVVRHDYQSGAGASTRTGIRSALLLGSDVIVTIDGDGQHNPEDIPRMVSPISSEEADITIGSRFLLSRVPKYRAFGIWVISGLYNLGSKQKTSDPLCGFRAYSFKAARDMVVTENGFAFIIETLVKARRRGLRLYEVPVEVIYHSSFSQNSSTNPISEGLVISLSILKWRTRVELLKKC